MLQRVHPTICNKDEQRLEIQKKNNMKIRHREAITFTIYIQSACMQTTFSFEALEAKERARDQINIAIDSFRFDAIFAGKIKERMPFYCIFFFIDLPLCSQSVPFIVLWTKAQMNWREWKRITKTYSIYLKWISYMLFQFYCQKNKNCCQNVFSAAGKKKN